MLLTGVSQVRSLLICTPRYLALSTDSKVWPCSVYWEKMGCLDLFMLSTWHLLELNSMSKVRSQICNLSSSSEVGGGGWVGANGLLFGYIPYTHAGKRVWEASSGARLLPAEPGGDPHNPRRPWGTQKKKGNGRPLLLYAKASADLWHTPPAHPSAHIGGLPGHAAAQRRRPRWRAPAKGLWHTPPARTSAHIGGLPGHTAAQQRRPPLARHLGRAMAHPSGAPLRPHRRPPRACGGPTATPPSGAPPGRDYGTPLWRAPPPT